MCMQREIRISALSEYIQRIFCTVGMTAENASTMADIIVRCTMYQRGHHDAGFVPNLIQQLSVGKATANPSFRRLSSMSAIESWDGDNGLGPLCCTKAIERAMELAHEYGIGMCCMRRTNHFMSAGPYVELAASHGYIGLILAKGGITMGAPNHPKPCISALPMGFAYPTEHVPVMLDACIAYASMEKLRQMARQQQPTPEWWGYDADGLPTDNPSDMLAGTRLPIGGHKGFALAMLGEVLTGVLSGGCVMDEKVTEDGVSGATSHTAIALRTDALMDSDTFRRRAASISEKACTFNPGLHIPGQYAASQTAQALQRGTVLLDETHYLQLNELAGQYSLQPLEAV